MNFIGTIKAGVYIQHLLKDLYCPVEQNQIHDFFRYKLSFQVVQDGLGVFFEALFCDRLIPTQIKNSSGGYI